MNLVQSLLGLTLIGTEWVLWLLIFLSIISLAIMLERAIFFARLKIDYGKFNEKVTQKLLKGEIESIKELCQESPAIEAQIVLKGFEYTEKGGKAMEEAMAGFLAGERQKLDRGLIVLGTLGNNAPFIGLFGTVLGIIKAFHDLAANPVGGPSVVMSGISEALIATAVGLIVAIPAVVAYNIFQRIVKRKMTNAESLKKLIVAHFL
ncbi:MAG: MotA/TolQ/ExbB proton channel family protein [Oligoflexales bacterium]|nr:MotA/TolQ/ExbB proton channel family protein [Oligoflexales bacterium]